jgi:uncharacterized repeat protein (TIGR03803 family)
MMTRLASVVLAILSVGVFAVTQETAPIPASGMTHHVLFSVLHTFTGVPDGAYPSAGLVMDKAGNLYGTTGFGGDAACTSGCGTLFKLDKKGTETVLHSFTGGADGDVPTGDLLRDAAGNLYSTTAKGGTSDVGTVFEMDTSGNETILYSFAGNADGTEPLAGLVMDAAGNLYGSTSTGGDLSCYSGNGCGTLYKLDRMGTETVLHAFAGTPDGAEPFAGLILDKAGNLYGTTVYGGDAACATFGCGTVFKLDKKSTETVLYSFPGGNAGYYPFGALVLDASGNLYGTTASGGASGHGTVFKLDRTGKETVLYSFTGGADGAIPYAGLIRDMAGNLYGTTYAGGTSTFCTNGCGTVFKLNKTGKETVLHSFGGADGAYPFSRLIRDKAGNLYGTTVYGGDLSCYPFNGNGCGTAFKITP